MTSGSRVISSNIRTVWALRRQLISTYCASMSSNSISARRKNSALHIRYLQVETFSRQKLRNGFVGLGWAGKWSKIRIVSGTNAHQKAYVDL